MPVIVVSEPNWADEFDMFGFQLYESEEKFRKDLESWKECVLKNYYRRNAKIIEQHKKEEEEFNTWWEKEKKEFNLQDSDYWTHTHKLYQEKKPYKQKPYTRLPDLEFYFGTNEAFYFSPEKIKDIDSEFNTKEISQETYDELVKVGFKYGGFWLLDRGDCYDEEDE